MKGRKLTLVERKYPLKRKKSGTWKVNTKRSALNNSKVPCNDAEHGESLGNIDIADTLFNGFALAFGGRR